MHRIHGFKYSLVSIALLCPILLRAQTSSASTVTTINLNNTVLQSPVKRLGVNLGAANFYDSGQMLKNLIVSNPGFEGEIAQTMVLCSAGTQSSCTDSYVYSGWPADYWDGATYTVIYGTAIGRTGTISTSTAPITTGSAPMGAVLNFADTSGTAPSAGDYMIVKKPMPPNFCGGIPLSCTPSAVEGWGYTLGGGGTVSTDTTPADLPSDTVGTQSLVMTAPAGGSATITYYFDSYSGHTFLQLNGSYTLSFKAKTTIAGGSTMYVSLQRLSGNVANPYVYDDGVKLTNQWQTFNYTFNASETGTAVGSVRLIFATAVAGNTLNANQVYLDDTSLVKNNTDATNPTVFRDEVVNTLKQLNPGVVRFWFNQEAETLDNLLAPQLARQRSQYQYVDVNYISYGLGEFLQLLQTVGSGTSSPPEPWIVVPITLSDAEASNLIDYLAGDGTTVYGAKRIAAGQVKPWTQEFPKIHLEFSNEAWNNGLYGGNMANGQAYGTRAQNVFAIMKNNANYKPASFDLMINGQATNIYNETIIQKYCNNNDTFASQPYMMLTVNDPFNGADGTLQNSPAAIETLFGSTFAEAEAFVTPSGTAEGIANGFVLQNIGVAQSSGRPVQYAVTETNVDPFEGTLTQAEADSYTTSIGGGMALIDSMLQNMRAGVLTQNIFSLAGYQYFPYNEPSLFLYGSVVDMGVTNLKRPQFLAEEMANNAIGANTTMLQTVHTGLDPTWSIPTAVNSVQLNNAHYLQSFGFNSGDNYSLIIINTNRSASEQVNFGGANVPGGTVQMTVLTSANITDTNETASVFAPVTSTLNNFNAAAGLTLPPFSMTTLTWTAPAISNVTVSAVTGTSATISWTTDDATSTSVVNYGTTTAYGSQSATTPAGATQSVTLTGLTAGTSYNFAVMATNGAGATSSSANFTFGTMASFTVSAPAALSLAQGQNGTVPVIVADTNGYTGPVNLTVTGLPPGATGTFQTTSGSASLVLTVPSTVLAATYPLSIIGTAGGTTVTAPLSLTVSGASQSQTITFNAIGNQYIGAVVTAVATASSGGTVTFSVVQNGNCSSSGTNGSTIKFLNAGNCGVIASQAGNATYEPVSQGQIVVINSALPPQTITFNAIPDQTVGSTLSLMATSSAGLTVSFSSSTPAYCTVSGTTASFIAAPGTCTIVASQAGNSSYAAAPNVPQSLNVKGQTQSITFPTIATQTAGTSLTLAATASSGLSVSFASTTQSVCSISGTAATTLTLNTGGNCSITASQAGNSTYAAATSVSQTFTVNAALQSQTITFPAVAAQNVGTPLTLTGLATASSGLAVSYASTTPMVCTVSGSTASFSTTGTCSITASQAGNSTYSAATPVSQNITVNAALKTQTITFNPIAAQYVGTPVTLTGTASSSAGLTVSFASTTTSICTVSGTTTVSAQFLNAGTCTIVASQAGNGTYAAAAPVSQNITVNATSYTQTITFGTIATQTVGTPLTLAATASSNLTVSFASTTPSVCTVSSTTATFIAAGTCSITASQAGNASYAAATPVSQSFTVQSSGPTNTMVSLGSAATLYGIFNNGSTITNGGLDTSDYAYSANLLGTSLTFQGIPYSFGTPESANAATSTTIALPAGSYSALNFLGTAIYGNQTAQTFTVTYTDGTSSTFTQSMSDWGAAQNYTGETVASAMPYRLTPSGAQPTGQTWNLYAYSFALNGAKTVQSFTLPNIRNVTVLAVTLSASQAAQTITFGSIAAQNVAAPLTLNATASSGLAVTYASSTTSVCTVSGSTATFLATGTCTITASQAGSSTYAAATPVSQSFAVNSTALKSQTITFGTIATQTAATSLTLSATASSGLGVTYASSTAGVCTVSGSTASLLTAGTCTIVASQSGNGAYAAAASVSQSFTVNAASQTITFNAIPAQILGGTLTVSATATSGLPVTFTVVPNGNCSISGNVVTFLGTGNCGVVANQAGNSTYAAAPAVGQIVVVNNPTAQTITFGAIAAQTVGTPLTLSATASSNLAVSYASSTTSVCTVSGSTASFAAAGTCTITASQPGNNVYSAAAPVSQSFTVSGAALKTQTITFGTITTQTVGTPLTLSATASSGLTVSFASSTTGVCTVSGTGATFVAAGTCTITASQAGNTTYAAAPSVSQSFTVNGQPQTITFGTITAQTVGTPLTLSATASSGLAVSYASSTTGVCTVSGTGATFVAAGTCTITASQAGNTAYAAAPSVSQSFTVNAAALTSQTITFGAIAAQAVGTPLTLSATASSGLAVSYASSTTGVCTVSGSTATFVAAGTCTITASQAGNATYAAAPSVSQSFTVNGQAQTITFGAIAAQTVGTPLTLSATASSGLAVSYVSSTTGVCTVSGSGATFVAAGTCTITASQAGNTTYAAATSISQSFTVNAAALKSQTITFGAIAAQTAGTPLTLTATASSGLAVSYASSTTGICTVSGSTATFVAAGTCTITASQAGNTTYAAATSVSQSFTVNAAALKSQTITFNAIPAQTVGSTLTVSATASSGLPVTFTVVPNGNCSVSGNVVTFLNYGNCGVVANQAGNSAYAAAPAVGQIIVVNLPTPQTITFGAIATQTVGTPLTLTATANSGLAVSYASSTTSICTVSGSTATFVAAGTCTITASQAGNSTYSAATSVSQSFTVKAATLTSQTITFNPIAAQTVGKSLTVSATASSGLPVSFVIVPNGNCSISGSVVTFLNQGNCGVIATQAGNSTYAAAPAVGQIIVVN